MRRQASLLPTEDRKVRMPAARQWAGFAVRFRTASPKADIPGPFEWRARRASSHGSVRSIGFRTKGEWRAGFGRSGAAGSTRPSEQPDPEPDEPRRLQMFDPFHDGYGRKEGQAIPQGAEKKGRTDDEFLGVSPA